MAIVIFGSQLRKPLICPLATSPKQARLEFILLVNNNFNSNELGVSLLGFFVATEGRGVARRDVGIGSLARWPGSIVPSSGVRAAILCSAGRLWREE